MTQSEETKRPKSLCLGIMSVTIGVISLMVGSIALRPGPGDFFDISIDQSASLLFVSVLFGILAIITGKLSEFKVVFVLGIVNVAFFTCIFLGTFFQLGEAWGRKEICRVQMRGVSSAMKMYCQENERSLPDADTWCDQLLSVENIDGVSVYYLLTEQADDSNYDEKTSWFAINKNLDGNRLSEIDRQTVLLFEAEPDWNQSGTLALLTSKEHPGFWPFSEGGYYFVFVGPDSNFTVKFIKNSEVDSLNWTPK